MADDLTRDQVIDGLLNEVDFYDKEITRRADDVENIDDRVHLETLKRERDQRIRTLKTMRRSENT